MLENLTTEFIFNFMLIFARFGTAFSLFPAIDNHNFLVRGRLILAASVVLLLYPLIVSSLPKYSHNLEQNISLILIEMITGFIIGIGAKFYFASLYVIGQVISMQSGLGSAMFFDPNQNTQTVIFSNLLTMSVILSIFVTDTHYLFIQSAMDSYTRFPAGELLAISDMSKFITHIVNDSFILAFKMSSPFLILSIIMLVGAGVLSRLMPNLQIFFVITPVQILVMFAVLYLVINIIVEQVIASIGMTL